jgi:hypothetical protein
MTALFGIPPSSDHRVQAVGQFMQQDQVEVRFGLDIFQLILSDQEFGGGHDEASELLLHHIPQQQSARSLARLYDLIRWPTDAHRFGQGIIACKCSHIINANICLRAMVVSGMSGRQRQGQLHIWQHLGKTLNALVGIRRPDQD